MIRKTIQYNPTGDSYCFNILLVSTAKDIGFLDTYFDYTYTYYYGGYYFSVDHEGLGLENLFT